MDDGAMPGRLSMCCAFGTAEMLFMLLLHERRGLCSGNFRQSRDAKGLWNIRLTLRRLASKLPHARGQVVSVASLLANASWSQQGTAPETKPGN